MAQKSQRQLNIRVDAETFDVLEAVAFLDGASLPDVIRPVIEQLAEELEAADPAIQLALRARAERSALRTGKLARLPRREADT